MALNPSRLKELREQKRLLQKDIAETLHISDRQYRRYEAENVDTPVSKVEILADLYEVSTDYLLNRTDDPTPPKNRMI